MRSDMEEQLAIKEAAKKQALIDELEHAVSLRATPPQKCLMQPRRYCRHSAVAQGQREQCGRLCARRNWHRDIFAQCFRDSLGCGQIADSAHCCHTVRQCDLEREPLFTAPFVPTVSSLRCLPVVLIALGCRRLCSNMCSSPSMWRLTTRCPLSDISLPRRSAPLACRLLLMPFYCTKCSSRVWCGGRLRAVSILST
jgi:hypothetical protein